MASENDGHLDEASNKLITNEVYNKVELSDVYGNVDDLGRINNDYENIFDNYGSHKMTQHGSLGSSSLESPAMQTTALMNMGTFWAAESRMRIIIHTYGRMTMFQKTEIFFDLIFLERGHTIHICSILACDQLE